MTIVCIPGLFEKLGMHPLRVHTVSLRVADVRCEADSMGHESVSTYVSAIYRELLSALGIASDPNGERVGSYSSGYTPDSSP